jgi:nucleoid-associated protein YgaU
MEFVQDRQSTVISGVAALLLIVAGFLVFNFLASLTKTLSPSLPVLSTQDQLLNNEPSNLVLQRKAPFTYTVVRGDSLSSIAQKIYNDGNLWTLIASANNLANPQVIHAGNVLVIPPSTASAQAPPASATLGASTANSVRPGSTYTVKSGDTLWDLAIRAYGSGYEWYRIDQANRPIPRNGLGKPLIFSGQQLQIP